MGSINFVIRGITIDIENLFSTSEGIKKTMFKCLLVLILGISVNHGRTVYPVPDPYRWDESFTTEYPQIDDEHRGLFNGILLIERENTAKHLDAAKTKYRDHFLYEEIVSWAKNWLAQHIKNTDHAYRGKLYVRGHYIVPNPYVWDTSFSVDIKQMDDEHVGLFDVVREMEANPGDQATWDKLMNLYNQHFANEEDLFTQILDNKHDIADHRGRHLGLMKTIAGAVLPITEEITEFIKNWLAQHIKNTDFDYRGKMPEVYPIPDPFVWDASFAVFYPDMDDEHKPLFSCVEELKTKPDDADLLASCYQSYVDHFVHEQSLFTKYSLYPAEEAYQHTNKHNAFLATMRGLKTPVPSSWIDYATNWLTQHIKNTDFRYKNKMPHPVADPYVWDESFLVNYKRLDDEHVILFKALQDLSEHPNDVDLLNYNRDIFRDHFDYEEKQFMACGEPCKADAHKKKHDVFFKTLTWVTNPVSQEYCDFAKNWLAQHIKNTDFLYKYKLPTSHKVPEPYVWNEQFAVFYKRLDEEHQGLFDALRDIDWDYCKDHKRKHVLFSERLAKMDAPVDNAEIKWSQNWLAQHIMNTDFGYRGKLA